MSQTRRRGPRECEPVLPAWRGAPLRTAPGAGAGAARRTPRPRRRCRCSPRASAAPGPLARTLTTARTDRAPERAKATIGGGAMSTTAEVMAAFRERLERRVRHLPPARRLRFGLALRSLERFANDTRLRVLDAGAGAGILDRKSVA